MLIRADAVLPGGGASALVPGVVRVEADRIVAVGPPGASPPAGDEPVIDLLGSTLLPGLVDAHDHLMGPRPDRDDADSRDGLVIRTLVAASECTAHLQRGVTSVRLLGCEAGLDVGLERGRTDGMIRAPWLQSARRAITDRSSQDRMSVGVHGPAQARAAVRAQVESGAAVIKLMASGGISAMSRGEDLRDRGLSRAELLAGSEAAHDAGRRVAIHAIGAAAIDDALLANADTIEHGIGLTRRQAGQMARSGAVLVPTMSTYRRIAADGPSIGLPAAWSRAAAELAPLHVASVRSALEEGVAIAVGSDGFGDVHTELMLLVDLGVRPIAAIDMACRGGAVALGQADAIGTIVPGFRADLAVVRGRPDLEIGSLSAAEAVFLAGSLLRFDGQVMSQRSEVAH